MLFHYDNAIIRSTIYSKSINFTLCWSYTNSYNILKDITVCEFGLICQMVSMTEFIDQEESSKVLIVSNIRA